MRRILFVFILFYSTICNAQNRTNINSDDFKVNGVVNIFTSKDYLKKAFGKMKITKVEEPNCSFDNEDYYKIKFYNYSINGITFLVYNKEVELEDINLKDNQNSFLLYKNFKINKNTSVKELQKYFPRSYKNFIKEKNNFITIGFGKDFDDTLIFEIKNGKIITILYQSLCG